MIQLRGPYNIFLIVAVTAVAQLTNAQPTRLPSTVPVAFNAGGSGVPAGAMTTTAYVTQDWRRPRQNVSLTYPWPEAKESMGRCIALPRPIGSLT